MEIKVPEPQMTDYGRAQFATETAFATLLADAKNSGLSVRPVMGLMYLPSEDLTRNFEQACRAILLALTPKESHVLRDGEETFSSEG